MEINQGYTMMHGQPIIKRKIWRPPHRGCSYTGLTHGVNKDDVDQLGHRVCRYNYGVGGDIWNITWRHTTVGTSNSLNDTWRGEGGRTPVSSSLMDVEPLREVMLTGRWFLLPEKEERQMRSTSIDAGGSLVVKEDWETLMTFVTQIQPGRQFRFVKIKRR